jgi:hypothetical protein
LKTPIHVHSGLQQRGSLFIGIRKWASNILIVTLAVVMPLVPMRVNAMVGGAASTVNFTKAETEPCMTAGGDAYQNVGPVIQNL